MDSTDRLILSRKPCQFCGNEPKPMSQTIHGGWYCGANIIFDNGEYSISRSPLCHANEIIPLHLTKNEIKLIIDALKNQHNIIDDDTYIPLAIKLKNHLGE